MKPNNQLITFSELIKTKLYPPQVRTGIVHRKRLFDKLNSANVKLILLAAPAGFGKSTLLLDWLKNNRHTFAWLSLDESDNDTGRFYQYLCAAFQTCGIRFNDDLLSALRGGSVPQAETIVTQIINTLHIYGKTIILVLDDYYFIQERTIHTAVNSFLEHLPVNVRLIISTRIDPLLPLHRMRVRGELTEIRERDLRFTIDESLEFFKTTMQIHLSDTDIKKLAERTEGWIAGLQLAAVSMQDSPDVQKFIESFTGTNRYVLDYLLEEVLNHQSKEVQMFLLQTSILKQFNEDLCNTITGGMNSRRILEQLEHSNLFLIPLDDSHEWFRYHHLFSELLQYRLRQLYPGLVDELHHNASVWFEEKKNISEAIEYTLRVKNYERAAYLLDQYGVYFLSRSELSTLINYQRRIPVKYTDSYPKLLATKAWALMLMHETGDIKNIIDRVELLIEENKIGYSPEEIAEAKAHVTTLNAYILRLQGSLPESLSVSQKLLANVPADNSLICGLLSFNIGRIYMKYGYAERTTTILSEAFDDNFRAGNYYVSLAILGHLGHLRSITESLPAAQKYLQESLELARKEKLMSLPAAGYIHFQLGRALYHLNELDEAMNHLERAVHLGEVGNEPDIICNALIVRAFIYAIQGEREKAINEILCAEEIEKKSPISLYEIDIRIERLALDLLLGNLHPVSEWIKNADRTLSDNFTVIDESRILLMIRYTVRTGEYESALQLITVLREKCDERKRCHTLLQLDIFEAILLKAINRNQDAMRMLNKGLEQAANMGYIRVLLNIGKQLSDLILYTMKEQSLSYSLQKFISKVMPLLADETSTGYIAIPKYKQNLIEPLTEREQEVLYYLSQNLSNKEIASKLFVSLDTIKSHVKHIYSKLNVKSRTEAVMTAKESGLLGEL